jgi:cytochrome P450
MTNHFPVDPLLSEPIRDIYFDKDRDAWVVSRYDDVLAVFRSRLLHLVGPRSKLKTDQSAACSAAGNDEWLRMRAETRHALAPEVLSGWKNEITALAQQLLDEFPIRRPVDLVHEYAEPVCRRLAVLATGIAPVEAESLSVFAAEISASAAEPFDHSLAAKAKAAEGQLRPYFHTGPLSLRDSGFVALSQTLAHMLANIWLALIQQPSAWNRLHQEPALTPRAVEELLRYAGLTRILFRMASQPTHVNGTAIHKGDRLILRIAEANRDPAHFHDADSLDISRRYINHFSLGNGRNSCVGAPLIRMALVSLTSLLVNRYREAVLCQEITDWRGGAGFRFPGALQVYLQ